MKIEFFTEDDHAIDYPPIPAKKFIPDWYKKMDIYCVEPTDIEKQIEMKMDTPYTIRGCVPVLDYLSSGYIIRSPVEIRLSFRDIDGQREFASMNAGNASYIQNHSYAQCPVDMNGNKNTYIKIINSWGIKTPAGYSSAFFQPEFFFENRYKLLPGIVDTDLYHVPVNFPGYSLVEDKIIIMPGDPIMVVFPFKRETWEIQVKQVDKIPMKKNFFLDNYKKLFHTKKSYK